MLTHLHQLSLSHGTPNERNWKVRWVTSATLILSMLYSPTVFSESSGSEFIQVAAGPKLACTASAWTTGDSPAGLRINAIHINAGDIFDKSKKRESLFIHTAANLLHVNTRRRTIAQVLPLKPGDILSNDSLAEAERILRSRRYLQSAVVVPVERCGDLVNIEVRTVDNWTLTPAISFKSAGGTQKYKFEVQDLNVLGLGKELTFRQEQSGTTRETTLAYGDDNVLGGRHQLHLTLGDTDNGDLYEFATGLPFATYSTERSWWFRASSENKSLVQSGGMSEIERESISENADYIEQDLFDAGFAKKLKHSNADIARVGFGFRYERQRTTNDSVSNFEDSSDFDEHYPYFYAQWARSNWTEQRNFLGLGKIEDIDSGLNTQIELGLVLNAFGNESDAIRFASTLSRGFWTGPNSLHRLELSQTHYFGGNRQKKFHVGAKYHYFRWMTEKDHLSLHFVVDQQRGYSQSKDFELGGEFGLRGYRNGYQSGDTRLLGIAEYRHISEWKPFSLLNLGWSVFAEAGKAWNGATHEKAETLADVGAGLMFSPTRSTRDEVIRLDVIFPLSDGPDVDSFLLYIGTQLKF